MIKKSPVNQDDIDRAFEPARGDVGKSLSTTVTAVLCITLLFALALWNYPFTYAVERSNHSVRSVAESSSKEPLIPLERKSLVVDDEVRLGKRLFHDVRLSRDNTISCASCHDVKNGGDDGLAVSVGIDGQLGELNAPTVLNCSLSIAQFWDGRAPDLATQAEGPIHNPIEMGSDWRQVIEKLSADKQIVKQFRQVYSSDITSETITKAIVAYESRLLTPDSPFDRFLRGHSAAISEDAKEGYALFKSLGCVSCHQGMAVGGNMFQEFGILGQFKERFSSEGDVHRGRFNVTNRSTDLHRFKVPGLRNVALTAPYFHDGSAADLGDAIKTMAEFQLGEELRREEVELIEQFLVSLTGILPEELR